MPFHVSNARTTWWRNCSLVLPEYSLKALPTASRFRSLAASQSRRSLSYSVLRVHTDGTVELPPAQSGEEGCPEQSEQKPRQEAHHHSQMTVSLCMYPSWPPARLAATSFRSKASCALVAPFTGLASIQVSSK